MLKPLFSLLLPALLSAPSLGASLVLGTFDTPAPDSAAVRQLYGITAFSNDASPRALSVGSDGVLTLSTTLVNEPNGEYSAKAGIRVPLNALGTPTDIRKATGISFRIKGSGA